MLLDTIARETGHIVSTGVAGLPVTAEWSDASNPKATDEEVGEVANELVSLKLAAPNAEGDETVARGKDDDNSDDFRR